MKLKEVLDVLNEMAVNRVSRHGDFSKDADPERSTMTHRTDRKIMRYSKTEALLKRVFSRFPQNVEIMIINDNNLRRKLFNFYLQSLTNDLSKIESDYGLEFPSSGIVLVFTGSPIMSYNKGRSPHTAWISVHRFWQELYESPGSNSKKMINPNMIAIMATIIRKIIGKRVSNTDDMTLPFKFRSAAQKTLTGGTELYYEILTEYCFMGKIRFQDARYVWDNLSQFEYEHQRSKTFEEFEKRYNKYTERLNQQVGKIAQEAFRRLDGRLFIVT